MKFLYATVLLSFAICCLADSDADSTYSNLYCQTDYVIKEKLFDVKNAENTFEILVSGDPKKLNCNAILDAEKERIYKDLRERQEDNATIDCNIKKLKDLEFHKLRFKINSLLGLSIPTAEKNNMRKKINKEIENAISQSVDVCDI
ncbi:unnamed protein product [Chironomus riparius]|uniref:Uncharacterized protein n=1 Tax=Chironomus riparius TaxID=315576 RepID=A0A9N9RLT1_9DIPT|nr:unnamed protein product [Chironomus riparius]